MEESMIIQTKMNIKPSISIMIDDIPLIERYCANDSFISIQKTLKLYFLTSHRHYKHKNNLKNIGLSL